MALNRTVPSGMADNTSVGHTTRVLRFPDLTKKKTKGKKNVVFLKKLPADQRMKAIASMAIEKERAMKRSIKYFDVDLLSFSATTVPGASLLTPISQGEGQSERIADTIFIHNMDIRFNIVTANSDIYNLARFVWFIWWQNTASVTPNGNSIWENTSSEGIFTMWNFQGREYYSILKETTFNMTGTAAGPTANSQQFLCDRIGMGEHRIDFNTGANSGVGHIYTQYMSDSALAPFVDFNMVCRFWYSDT